MFSLSKLVTKARARIHERREKRKAAKAKAPEADEDINKVLANRECEVRERAALEDDVDDEAPVSSGDTTPWPCPSPLATPVFPVRSLPSVAATGLRPALRLPGQQKATKAVVFQGTLENERYFWKDAAPVDLYPAHPIVGHPAHSAAVGLGAPKITASVNDVARAGVGSAEVDMEEVLVDNDDDKNDFGENAKVTPVCADTGTIHPKVSVHGVIVIPPRTTSLLATAIVIPPRTTSLLAAALISGTTASVSAIAASAPASVSGLVPAAAATAAAATVATAAVTVADTATVPARTARRRARPSLYTFSNASTVSLGAMGDINEERPVDSDGSGDEDEDGSDAWSVEGQQVCADDDDDDADDDDYVDSDDDSDFGVCEKNLLAARTAYHKALAHSYEVRAEHRADAAAKLAEERAKKAVVEAGSSEPMFRAPVRPLRRTNTWGNLRARLNPLAEEDADAVGG